MRWTRCVGGCGSALGWSNFRTPVKLVQVAVDEVKATFSLEDDAAATRVSLATHARQAYHWLRTTRHGGWLGLHSSFKPRPHC